MSDTSIAPKFIKPFSKGQITLPKNYRDYLGIDENSWLKISLGDNQILIQPVDQSNQARNIKPKLKGQNYLKVLSKIKGSWFRKKDYEKARKEVDKRLGKHEKSAA